jgi:hypothetical protein
MRFPASTIVVVFFLFSLGSSIAGAQSWQPHRSAACAPQRSAQPKPVPRTVNVNVPLPNKPHPVRFAPFPGCPPAPPVSRPPKPMPVQVQVSVQAAPPCEQKSAAIAYRDPGPVKPILAHGAALIGATIAAPFRLADMFVECRKRRACAPMMPACAPPRCGLPPQQYSAPIPRCPIPMTCAPVGPSAAPLPHAAGPSQCRPYLPPRMVREPEFPPCEPRSLIGGLFNLPFRLMQRARVLGDMRGPYECAPR